MQSIERIQDLSRPARTIKRSKMQVRVGGGTRECAPDTDKLSSIVKKMLMEHGCKFLNSLRFKILILDWL